MLPPALPPPPLASQRTSVTSALLNKPSSRAASASASARPRSAWVEERGDPAADNPSGAAACRMPSPAQDHTLLLQEVQTCMEELNRSDADAVQIRLLEAEVDELKGSLQARDQSLQDCQNSLQASSASCDAALRDSHMVNNQLREAQAKLHAAECRSVALQGQVNSLKLALDRANEATFNAQSERRVAVRRLPQHEATCVICLEEAPEYAVVPCGHLAFCDRCKPTEAEGPCPVCRQEVCMLLRVHQP